MDRVFNQGVLEGHLRAQKRAAARRAGEKNLRHEDDRPQRKTSYLKGEDLSCIAARMDTQHLLSVFPPLPRPIVAGPIPHLGGAENGRPGSRSVLLCSDAEKVTLCGKPHGVNQVELARQKAGQRRPAALRAARKAESSEMSEARQAAKAARKAARQAAKAAKVSQQAAAREQRRATAAARKARRFKQRQVDRPMTAPMSQEERLIAAQAAMGFSPSLGALAGVAKAKIAPARKDGKFCGGKVVSLESQ